MGPARIQCGKNCTGGTGQQAILEAGHHRMLHWRPIHPQAVYTACSLSSGPTPMHPSLHSQHPESPDHETVMSRNVYSGSRGTRARAGNGSKAHDRHRCPDTHQPLPSAFLPRARAPPTRPLASWGQGGEPCYHLLPCGDQKPQEGQKQDSVYCWGGKIGERGGGFYLPLLVDKMIPLPSP